MSLPHVPVFEIILHKCFLFKSLKRIVQIILFHCTILPLDWDIFKQLLLLDFWVDSTIISHTCFLCGPKPWMIYLSNKSNKSAVWNLYVCFDLLVLLLPTLRYVHMFRNIKILGEYRAFFTLDNFGFYWIVQGGVAKRLEINKI